MGISASARIEFHIESGAQFMSSQSSAMIIARQREIAALATRIVYHLLVLEDSRAVEEITTHLSVAPPDEYLLIPGFGALCAKRYTTYRRTGPETYDPQDKTIKFLPYWICGEAVLALADGDTSATLPPLKKHKKFLKKFRKALSVDARLPEEGSPVFALFALAFEALREQGTLTIQDLGTFSVIDSTLGGKTVQFEVDAVLKERISEARP